MMKNLNIFLTLAFLLVFSACEKDRSFIEFKDLEYGAVPRLTDGVNGEFDFFNPTGSSIDFTVEFYDENQGKNVQSYAWTVAYINKTTNEVGAAANIGSFSASDFKPNDFGLPSIKIEFTFQQALDALGLTTADINGGDAIRFEATLTKTDGKVFTRNNTGPSVISNGPAFGAWFVFDQNIVCPSAIEGTYTSTATGTSTDGCCPDEITVTSEVTLTAKGSGVYTISDWSAGMYLEWYDVYGITAETDLSTGFIDACGKITVSDPTYAEPFGETLAGSGAFDANTGVITYSWENGWGDKAVVILTPK